MNQTRLNEDRSVERAEYRLTKEERETIYRIDEVDNTWYADSTVQKDIHKLERRGWIETGVQYYNDGTVMAKQFKAPRNCLSPRTYNPDKPKKTMSAEHKQKVMDALKASRETKKAKENN
jgi:hypothetical protein